MNKEIQICFIKEFPSLLEGIFSLTGISKNQIKKHFDKKKLNKEVEVMQEFSIPLGLLNYGKVNPVYLGPVIKTLFEDENFLIIDKPAKIHCHPLGYDENDNTLSYLHTIAPKLLKVNQGAYDRGLFYRLDYETSGILYFAKNDEIQKQMRQNFQDIVKEKIYLAVVTGKTDESGSLEHKLQAFGEGKSKVRVDENGSLYQLEYKRLDYNQKKDLSLLEVKLKQGFRHQIRVQLQAIGYPILGDPLYGNKDYKRMMLHCYQYKFQFNENNYSLKCELEELRSLFTNFNS